MGRNRALTIDREQAAIYCVRDAHRVSDAEVGEGKSSPIVHRADTIDDGLAWCAGELAA
jgi:hypothetical protein